MEQFKDFITGLAYAIELVGVAVMVVGFVVASGRYMLHPGRFSSHQAYTDYRHRMGRSIIVCLDFMIGGDIIKTIVVQETLTNIVVLGAIVLIRTFLSLTLHVEVEGRWPWQETPHE